MHCKLLHVMRTGVSIRYAVKPSPEAWVLPEGPVPESIPHDEAAEHLKLLLGVWAGRSEKERERAAREALERRVAELEAKAGS